MQVPVQEALAYGRLIGVVAEISSIWATWVLIGTCFQAATLLDLLYHVHPRGCISVFFIICGTCCANLYLLCNDKKEDAEKT